MFVINPFPTICLQPTSTYDTASSASRGFEVRRKISAETSSFVLRIVSLHSLASLFGSTRPRIPTLPVVLMCSTPAITSCCQLQPQRSATSLTFDGFGSIPESTDSLLPDMTLPVFARSTSSAFVNLIGKIF